MLTQPRRYADLRPSAAPAEKVDEDAIDRVLQRIGITRDGALMLAWLRDECRRPLPPGQSDAALREDLGARRAYDRLLQMSEGTVR